MSAFRGLARTTILCRRNEAGCFLVWLGERATREGLSRLTLHDVDAYMKHRASSLRRISLKTVAGKMRGFLRWLHMAERTTRDLSPTVLHLRSIGSTGHEAMALYSVNGSSSALLAQSSVDTGCGGCYVAIAFSYTLTQGTTYYLAWSGDATFTIGIPPNNALNSLTTGSIRFQFFATAANAVTWSSGTPTFPSTTGTLTKSTTGPIWFALAY
jgi:hypothetical protein